MAYNDLLSDEGLLSDYLIVMKPARVVTGFTLFDDFTYSVSFDYGEIVSLTEDGSGLTEASSTTLASGEYFYDVDTEILYVRVSDDSNPSTKTLIGTYEITVATNDQHFHRVPTDDTTREVYFEPFVVKEPKITASQQDGFFGLLPTTTSTINLNNAEHFFERHVYDSSFKNKVIDIYHTIKGFNDNDIKVENTKKVFSGLMSDISYSQEQLSIRVFDRVDIFKQEFRNTDTSFYKKSDFADLDPAFEGKPIRYVYGRVEGFVPVNLDYVDDSPTTSDNRIWGVRADKANTNDVSQNTSTGSTATVIEFGATPKFGVRDSIKVGAERTFVTEVGANNITVSPAVTAPGSGVSVTRATVSRVVVLQGEEKYELQWDRDYVMNTGLSNDVLGITLTNNFEASLGMSVLTPGDQVLVTVYGKENNVTLGGPAFGADDDTTGNLTSAPVIILDLLKKGLGIPESDIDSSSFTTLLADTTEALSFAIPASSSGEFPTFKKIFGDITKTVLLKWYLDNDTKWSVSQVKPIAGTPEEIDDSELIRGPTKYDFQYEDIVSDVVVEYRFRELREDVNKLEEQTEQVTGSSNIAKWLHGVDKTRTIRSLHLKEADAQTLADRMAFVFGDRMGKLTVRTKNEFLDTLIDDKLKVQRDRLPGFEFEDGTERSRDFVVIEVDRGLRDVRLVLDDQKGIEDNSGSW